MKNRTFILIILTLFSLNLLYGQTFERTGFVHIDPPKISSSGWFSLNHSNNEFAVSVVNNKLQITKAKYQTETEIDFNNGKLIGTNHGEWGGELKFVPNDTTSETVKIKDGNIKFIFHFNNEVFFVEGLAHLGINQGALYRIEKSDSAYKYEKVIEFEDAPEALTISNNTIYIGSHSAFYIVDHTFKKITLFKNTFWSSLYPNSIAVLNDKTLYMGIRSGYVEIDLELEKFKFYKYKK